MNLLKQLSTFQTLLFCLPSCKHRRSRLHAGLLPGFSVPIAPTGTPFAGRRQSLLLGFDVIEHRRQALVLRDGGMGDALIFVENPVG